jgi:hypothetical protein
MFLKYKLNYQAVDTTASTGSSYIVTKNVSMIQYREYKLIINGKLKLLHKRLLISIIVVLNK